MKSRMGVRESRIYWKSLRPRQKKVLQYWCDAREALLPKWRIRRRDHKMKDLPIILELCEMTLERIMKKLLQDRVLTYHRSISGQNYYIVRILPIDLT